MDRDFVFTRDAALQRLDAIVPHAGRAYAAERNHDTGPDGTATTSVLSPYLRRRLVTEQEVVAAAYRAHGPARAERFIGEVFWRSYFKGFLETHPAIWSNYRDGVAAGRDQLAKQPGLRRVFADAEAGRTGIDGFDDWARELASVGWLHNHARMWFASIWIFTLRLPWALGADLFMRRLVDGDPASNTLSWRWVAGLHTRGKNYVARAENIARYTGGRFSPVGLDEHATALSENDVAPLVALPRAEPLPRGDVALLLHLDDLNPESLALGDDVRITRIGGLLAHAPDATPDVREADESAMTDGLARASAHFGCPAAATTDGWAGGAPVVTAWAPVGPSADALPPDCIRVRRRWDELTWPRATRGYFQVRSAIPAILREVGMSSDAGATDER